MKERLALWQHRAAFGSTVGPDGSLTQDEIDIGPDEATCYGCGLMLAFGDRRAKTKPPSGFALGPDVQTPANTKRNVGHRVASSEQSVLS